MGWVHTLDSYTTELDLLNLVSSNHLEYYLVGRPSTSSGGERSLYKALSAALMGMRWEGCIGFGIEGYW